MGADRSRRDYPLKAQARGPWGVARHWYLRFRLRLAEQGIDRLERQLASEFATLDTLPLHEEIEALRAEREALLTRLAERP